MGLVVALVTAGCGSSGSGTAGGTTGSTAAGGSAPARGIKGESAAEKATDARLSAGDCTALAKLAEHQIGTRLKRRSIPRPPLSRCRLDGRGISINEYLDTGFAAHQRYENRIVDSADG